MDLLLFQQLVPWRDPIAYNVTYVSSIAQVHQVYYVQVELISEKPWITFPSYDQPSLDLL